MPIWLRICSWLLVLIYVILANVLMYLLPPANIFMEILYAFGFALFIIIVTGQLLSSLPNSISKYFRDDYNSETS